MAVTGALQSVLPASFSGVVLTAIPLVLLGLPIVYLLYNILLHPLRKFPGPTFAGASPIPLVLHHLRGDSVPWILDLHEKHGEVVRISPNELSFSGAGAYKDIYGHRKPGQPAPEKEPLFYTSPLGEIDIVTAGFHDHARMRRIFAHAFSDRALKLQEPLFNTYVDRLVRKLKQVHGENSGHRFDMVSMYNFTTFDVMGDLTFGEPLNLLEDTKYHPWIKGMLAGFKFGAYLHSMRYFSTGIEKFLIKYCMPNSLKDKLKVHKELSAQRVDRRLEKPADARPDIWGLVLSRDEKSGLSKEEMYSNSDLFMIAGTETTATLLSGLTYYLLVNPDKLQKLTAELRKLSETDISTIEKLQTLPYLNACIEEGLRMYPPVVSGLPRRTPRGFTTNIDGHDVPGDSRVLVTNLAANRNPQNWRNAYQFVPERWLSDAPESKLYEHDKKHGFQPFSTGPRACLGKNMAYHEMRLIAAKVFYNFDLTLCEESNAWNDQEIFILWNKKPLMCKLKPVVKA